MSRDRPPAAVRSHWRTLWRRSLPFAATVVTSIALTAFTVWFAHASDAAAGGAPDGHPVRRGRRSRSDAFARLAISPDGARLVYVGADQTIVRARPRPASAHGVAGPWRCRVLVLLARRPMDWLLRWQHRTQEGGGHRWTARDVQPTSKFPTGASWSPDDTIIFATTDTSTGLLRVAAAGGEPEVLTTPNRDQGRAGSLVAGGLAGWPRRALHDRDRWAWTSPDRGARSDDRVSRRF